MLDRREILEKVIKDCLCECYKWAQPSINFEAYLNNPEMIQDNEKFPFYRRYYLSQDNFKYILQSYKEAYHIGKDWNKDIDLLMSYITSEDSVKDVYIEGKDGYPGHRGYEKITPLQDITKDNEDVLDLIKTCKDFFKRDFEVESFDVSLYLGPSPNSNAEEVEKYWHEHGRPEFKIKEFNIEDVLYPEDDDCLTEEEFIETLKYKPNEQA